MAVHTVVLMVVILNLQTRSTMAVATNIRVRSTSTPCYVPGFYHALNSLSSADVQQESPIVKADAFLHRRLACQLLFT